MNQQIAQRPKSTLNIGQFLSIASQLALQSCEIIRDCSKNPDLKKYEKAKNDPVTEADYKVQTMIVRGFQKFFPDLRVVGQESVDFQGEISTDYEILDQKGFLPKQNKFSNIEIPYQELCVWIDPIDCTKGFISGKLDYVTCLIGVSRNKQAYLGVIGVPFEKNKQNPHKISYSPSIFIGVTQTHQAFQYTVKQQWLSMNIPPNHSPLRVTTSKSRAGQSFFDFCSSTKAQVDYADGSGNKIKMVFTGKADIMCYLASFTCKWDSCAGQAIVKSLGGYFTSTQGKQIQYDPDAKDYVNKKGFFCALDEKIHREMIEFFVKGKYQYEEYREKVQKQSKNQKN